MFFSFGYCSSDAIFAGYRRCNDHSDTRTGASKKGAEVTSGNQSEVCFDADKCRCGYYRHFGLAKRFLLNFDPFMSFFILSIENDYPVEKMNGNDWNCYVSSQLLLASYSTAGVPST